MSQGGGYSEVVTSEAAVLPDSLDRRAELCILRGLGCCTLSKWTGSSGASEANGLQSPFLYSLGGNGQT